MLKEAERISGVRINPTQGSYSRAYGASAGTHSGGGAVDISVRGQTYKTSEKLVKALRTVGFAAWHRSSAEGPWSPHIHAIAISGPDQPSVAKRQVTAYKYGRNGLTSNRLDKHRWMKVPFRTWEQYWRQYRASDVVTASNIKYGKKNEDVRKFQIKLREFLWSRKINPNKDNPDGVTGYFGYQTARMMARVHWVMAADSNNDSWKKASTRYASWGILRKIGLKYR